MKCIITAAFVGVLALGAGTIGATAPPAPIPMAQSAYFPASTASPEGIGNSAIFNALAVYCQAGSMNACSALYSESPYDSQYESYGESCGGRQPSDSYASCDELLVEALAATPYTLTTTMLQPGATFEGLVPGIYISGPITADYCTWSTHDEWGYSTNSGYVSTDGLGQAVTAMMILPIDRSVEIDSECGPMTLVEVWSS
jgi:hypothetical protein